MSRGSLLDVLAQVAIRTFLDELTTERGTTVILTTHDLATWSDVDPAATRAARNDPAVMVWHVRCAG